MSNIKKRSLDDARRELSSKRQRKKQKKYYSRKEMLDIDLRKIINNINKSKALIVRKLEIYRKLEEIHVTLTKQRKDITEKMKKIKNICVSHKEKIKELNKQLLNVQILIKKYSSEKEENKSSLSSNVSMTPDMYKSEKQAKSTLSMESTKPGYKLRF